MSESSKLRKVPPPYQGQKGRCHWCGTADLPKGRSSWCSDECVEEYKMRSWPAHVRTKVYKRDHGICALCGIDADKAFREWQEARKEIVRLANRLHDKATRWPVRWCEVRKSWLFCRDKEEIDWKQHHREKQAFVDDLMARYAPPGNWTHGRSTGWDADHIVPVTEGGGDHGLDNYRTLCHPCHKIVTAELAARRAERVRQEKRLSAGDLFQTQPSLNS